MSCEHTNGKETGATRATGAEADSRRATVDVDNEPRECIDHRDSIRTGAGCGRSGLANVRQDW